MPQSTPIPRFLESPAELQQPLVQEQGRQIPGSVQYSIRRFARPAHWMAEDAGMIRYQVVPGQPEQNLLELRFCVSGQAYCNGGDACNRCTLHDTEQCHAKVDSLDVLSFVFSAPVLSQFVKGRPTGSHTLTDNILTFTHRTSFSRILPLCAKTRMVLEGLLNHNYTDSLENIYVNAQTQMLLLYSLDCMIGEKEIDILTCKFLANETDREKVLRAREILMQQIGEPITIKELSRKVAMNECYLKKGFKELFGTTIFDYFQNQRMEHAKYLLYEKGLSVTEVSILLGYSSISHFSTAFKKHTGLKPCELLLR